MPVYPLSLFISQFLFSFHPVKPLYAQVLQIPVPVTVEVLIKQIILFLLTQGQDLHVLTLFL